MAADAGPVQLPHAQVVGVALAEALQVVGEQNEAALDHLQLAGRVLGTGQHLVGHRDTPELCGAVLHIDATERSDTRPHNSSRQCNVQPAEAQI